MRSTHAPSSDPLHPGGWMWPGLVSGGVLLALLVPVSPVAGAGTGLRKVTEEAAKPVEDQELVFRERGSDDDCDEGDGPGLFEVVSVLFLDAMTTAEPSVASPRLAEPLQSRVSIASILMHPNDAVLHNLRGVGLSLRASSSRRELELTGSVLSGTVRSGQAFTAGLVSPWELGIGLRARAHLIQSRRFGLNAFVGARFGHLFWRYRTSVLAVDPSGWGQEIGHDSLSNGSAFFGVGLVPLRTRSFDLGVNLTTGMRLYFHDTTQGFGNDLFDAGTLVQVDIELVFRL